METYLTYASSDMSATGCLVLCNSLKNSGTSKPVSIVITNAISKKITDAIKKSFDYVINDNDIICEPRLSGDYLKIKIWLLTQFTKCVFLESDVLVLENVDDLFERPEMSAVSDTRWPDCFDIGVFVFEPSPWTFGDIIRYSVKNKIQNNMQCLLNMYFCEWSGISIEHKIPFIYNYQSPGTEMSFYTHSAALTRFGQSVKVARLGDMGLMIQTAGGGCPGSRSSGSGITAQYWAGIWQRWWRIFHEMVRPLLENTREYDFTRHAPDYSSKETDQFVYPHHQIQQPEVPDSGSSQQQCESVSVHLNEPRSAENCDDTVCTGDDRQNRWERGEIDYMGSDRFEHILAALQVKMDPVGSTSVSNSTASSRSSKNDNSRSKRTDVTAIDVQAFTGQVGSYEKRRVAADAQSSTKTTSGSAINTSQADSSSVEIDLASTININTADPSVQPTDEE